MSLNKADLIKWFEEGCKPKHLFRIGTEHEKFVYKLDTFKPVESLDIEEHTIHSEWCQLKPETAKRINEAKLAGGRIAAVGTTAVRVLETAALHSAGAVGSLSKVSERDGLASELSACAWRPVAAFEGKTDLYIYPGYTFRAVDVMVTNFHLPKSGNFPDFSPK